MNSLIGIPCFPTLEQARVHYFKRQEIMKQTAARQIAEAIAADRRGDDLTPWERVTVNTRFLGWDAL